MWKNVKYVQPKGFRQIASIGMNLLAPKTCCFGLWRVRRILSSYNSSVHHTDHSVQKECRTEPPWKVLFFGTDEFAVESLKILYASRQESSGRIVESLEVVTLDKDLPVRRFASANNLVVHDWPHVHPQGRFDVGVVVSFGCLLREGLIRQFQYGILNVHPSLLPRWRGPAPVFHTVLHGDAVTGVTIMQIRPNRFDVGPILSQEVCQVPEHCTSEQLGASLATVGASLLIETLKNLPERIANRKEQSKEGATLAPKINTAMSWVMWEEQTCDHISRLYRAIGSRVPLRTLWMGDFIKLLDFVGKFSVSEAEDRAVPGSILFHKESNTLLVRCKDGWVGFKTVMLRKRLSAADFYNGYLHTFFIKRHCLQHQHCLFQSKLAQTNEQPSRLTPPRLGAHTTGTVYRSKD
ncbi:methionyl-tRNA formyltransferase, mitochondrial isoform X1 [Anguilla rostrata]|uniref:methionyl-tRNA formyltransferase, mitochondrial isoform X1 n=1 Tax=Anguilla rostrata TaxID=7938 RepID=UPI0030D159D6